MNTEGGMIKFVKNNKVVDFDITDVHLCGLGSGVFKFKQHTVFSLTVMSADETRLNPSDSKPGESLKAFNLS